jgi:hypothetical protein
MPARPTRKKRPAPVKGRRIAATAKNTAGSVKRIRLDETGLTNRTRGHVSARGKRAQAKKDAR